MTTERAYWVAWSQAKGVGSVLLKRLQAHFGSLAAAWQADGSALLEIDGIGLMLGNSLVDYRQSIDPAAYLAQWEARGGDNF